jgi:hypothetical protein
MIQSSIHAQACLRKFGFVTESEQRKETRIWCMAEVGTDTLQLLYDSEINFELSSFWDGGFIWKLGDSANGYPAEGRAASVSEAISQLQSAAITHFPQSEFAKLTAIK